MSENMGINQTVERMETKLLKHAVAEYGIERQMDMLQEECAELIVAVNKVRRRKGDALENFFEEIADVEIMCAQMRTYFGDDRVDKWKKEKLRRLKEILE